MYGIYGYRRMIANKIRTDAYASALRSVVKPDSVVLDLGTGTGIFALLACKFGAQKVYAVEPDDAISVAQSIAAYNDFNEKIVFIQNISTQITLPEQVDIVISDLRGVLPPFTQHFSSIMDVRDRLLKPGGILIPRIDSLWVAIIEAPEVYQRHTCPWGDEVYGLDMQTAAKLLVNRWRKYHVSPSQLLAPAKCWGALDYMTIKNTNVSGDVVFTVVQDGTIHGLALWFDSVLGDDIGFSNAPGQPELIYGMGFFPLEMPTAVRAGDVVEVSLLAHLVGGNYVWRWNTVVWDQEQPRKIKTKLEQSTFFGQIFSEHAFTNVHLITCRCELLKARKIGLFLI